MGFTIEGLLDALALQDAGPDRYRARNVDVGHSVVFGGQLMAQSIAAAHLGHAGKTVKTLHIVFARAASPDKPLDITVDRLHSGRAMASSTITISQGDRLCTRSMVLLTADESDLIRHADRPAVMSSPAEASGHGDYSLVGQVGARGRTVVVSGCAVSGEVPDGYSSQADRADGGGDRPVLRRLR